MKVKKIATRIKALIQNDKTKDIMTEYYKRFKKYAFLDTKCESYEQFEASIIRLYHTIEKGLTYSNYRPGFGKTNVDNLLISLEQYNAKGYDINAFCYRTALSCLDNYIRKNKEHGYEDIALEMRIRQLPGSSNDNGGTIVVGKADNTKDMNYALLLSSRHSIRHFSDASVDIERIKDAIELARFTPSACNRQGWKTRIIVDKEKKRTILENQNGNKGFGQEIDKILVITSDLRAQQRNREIFQAFIDGGMYAENVLNSLYYYGIASIPLSAALTLEQEKRIKSILNISEAEVIILFIGIGYYPSGNILTTRSERKPSDVIVI